MTNRSKRIDGRTVAVFYEHPEWFTPLFTELDRRGVNYDRQLAYQHTFDPAETDSPYALVVNRMSPSAFTRGHARAIPYTLQYLAFRDHFLTMQWSSLFNTPRLEQLAVSARVCVMM